MDSVANYLLFLIVTKPGSNCYKLLLKMPEDDAEENRKLLQA